MAKADIVPNSRGKTFSLSPLSMFYRDSKELYRKYKDSRSGDKVLDAIALLNKHEKRKEKLEKAIDKHNKAKAEGKIVSKEDKEGGYNK